MADMNYNRLDRLFDRQTDKTGSAQNKKDDMPLTKIQSVDKTDTNTGHITSKGSNEL